MNKCVRFPFWACVVTALVGSGLALQYAYACGGFFCQLVPIDQAGEQIIFRQDGQMITAVVLIQYEGEADDFSWVVPVPGIPELSTGSDLVFQSLEPATRPQFVLEREGSACQTDRDAGGIFDNFLPGVGAAPSNEDTGVTVLETLVVGPFDVQVVSSEDPDAMAVWLEENEYDLTDRGRDLIAPYVEEGMNFVALRLRQDQGVGDIQPLIMRYESEQPMIPIRLTAVAAVADMGVIVWLLGESRAVPLNYFHVTPNYTRLNWYSGTFNAYASYQDLVTEAMDEAGGQGFATDYAGRELDFLSQILSVDDLTNELVSLSAIEDDASFIAQISSFSLFPQDKVLEILQRVLPLSDGSTFTYQVPELLQDVFSAEQIAVARATLIVELTETVIDPLAETLDVLDDGLYMTRLYTTLSAEEMTLDPTFSFNAEMEDQALTRSATLTERCVGLQTRWTLTLGEGTGRKGERVIDGFGSPPGFTPPVIDQDAVFRTERTATVGPPELVTQKSFAVAQVGEPEGGFISRLCGSGIFGAVIMAFVGLTMFRRSPLLR